jgi:hypothetical protein
VPMLDELIRVRTIGPYLPLAMASSPSRALRSSVPHTDGDDLPGDDEARGRASVDLQLDTHWSRILHFDLRTGHVGAHAEDRGDDGEDRPPPGAVAASSAPARPGRRHGVRTMARACGALLALVAAAYLIVAGLGQLTSPEAAAALGPDFPPVPVAPALPRAGSEHAALRELAFADEHALADSSRECAPDGTRDRDCIYP